ncbi:DUF4367 domain-containing protein [Paenibacillus brasilensis]|uniref:DUF4367 domain-containing protein n=1 Tax=Paenibacillus brasilensis TaxID=128574 RepID=A0ABU0L5J4_9BACL|nr:DUF4367 domain-containing protein [Paenibacillus brasilensis]MDQ0496526.1 hypothetical protein [Paenibacillus brasilensis]
MREFQHTVQDESIKEMDLLPTKAFKIQVFDVTDKVMDRVYQKEQRKARLFAKGLRSGIAVPAMISFFVLGASLTGYAASQYLEFRNSKGDVVLNTAKADEPTDFAKTYSRLLNAYSQQVKDQLQPGEYAAYYIKDDFMNNADRSNPIKFEYKQGEFSSFNSLQNEIKRTHAPRLDSPSHLPNGYRFDYGYVYPAFMYPKFLQNKEYRTLADELIQKSKTAPAGEKLLIKKLSWEKADFTAARYVKGSDYVSISITTLTPDSKLTVFQNDRDAAEKLTIKGTAAYYIKSGEISGASITSKNRLGWKDDDHHLLYEIYDNPSSPLVKQDLVKIAEDLLTSH